MGAGRPGGDDLRPRLLPDGRVEVPVRAEGPDGIIGDGLVVLQPGDECYDQALAEARRAEPN